MGGGLGGASAGNHRAANVHQSVQEGTVGEHHGAGAEGGSVEGVHTCHGRVVVVESEGIDVVLPHIQAVGILEHLAPHCAETHAVALRARAPHCRAFAAVEHARLYGGAVGDDASPAAKCVYLSDNLTLSNSADSGVARHLGNFVHVHGYEQHRAAQPCSGCGGFAPGMAGTHNNYVVISFHSKIYQTKNTKAARFGQAVILSHIARASFSWASIISRSPGPLSLMPHRWSTPCTITRSSSRW